MKGKNRTDSIAGCEPDSTSLVHADSVDFFILNTESWIERYHAHGTKIDFEKSGTDKCNEMTLLIKTEVGADDPVAEDFSTFQTKRLEGSSTVLIFIWF